MDFTWSVHEDLCGSNHFPTFLHLQENIPGKIPKWNFKKADWAEFDKLCSTEIQPNLFRDIKDDPVEIFTDVLHFIAEVTIPKTSIIPKRKNKPWWNDECEEAKLIKSS